MSFANPYIFLVLIIPFILFAWLVLTNKDGVERVFSKKIYIFYDNCYESSIFKLWKRKN